MSCLRKKYVALDGVACNFKTSSLTQLHNMCPDIIPMYCDYAEFNNQYGHKDIGNGMQTRHLPEFNSIYTAWFRQQSYELNAVYDRFPSSSLLYSLIFRRATDAEYLAVFAMMDEFKLLQQWKILVILPKEGDETLVLQAMIKRANGIDDLSVDYVLEQRKAFKMFADYFNLKIVYVSFTNVQKSINEICESLNDMIDTI